MRRPHPRLVYRIVLASPMCWTRCTSIHCMICRSSTFHYRIATAHADRQEIRPVTTGRAPDIRIFCVHPNRAKRCTWPHIQTSGLRHNPCSTTTATFVSKSLRSTDGHSREAWGGLEVLLAASCSLLSMFSHSGGDTS